MCWYRRFNGWYMDVRASSTYVRDPDQRIQAEFPTEEEARAWASQHNDHVKAGHHARGNCGLKMKKYGRR